MTRQVRESGNRTKQGDSLLKRGADAATPVDGSLLDDRTGAKPTLVTALDQNVGESESVEILNDYVLVVDGTCSFEIVNVLDGGSTHLIRVTGRQA